MERGREDHGERKKRTFGKGLGGERGGGKVPPREKKKNETKKGTHKPASKRRYLMSVEG